MRTRKWKDDLKAVLWVLALAFVFTIYACTGSLADNLIKDYDISWGTGDGPVGAEDPAVASGGWANLSPATDDIQATLDWIDSNWGSAGSSYWQRNTTVLTTATAGDTVELDQTSTTGNTLKVERNLAYTSTDSPVVKIHQDNNNDDQYALSVLNDANKEAIYAFSALQPAIHGASTSSFGLYGISSSTDGVHGESSTGHGVYGDGGAGNDDYGIFSEDKSKAGTSDTFDEWDTTASPYGVAPPASDAREYYLDTDYWFALNSDAKVYGWCDRDGDTGIDVEKTADLDKLNFKTGGTERAVLDSTGFDCAVEVSATGQFDIAGTNGVGGTITIITDVDFGAQQVQYRELTFTGGIITAIGSESAWTPAPLSP